MNSAEFLTQLWGPHPPGLILTWELRTKHSTYLKSPAGATGIQPGAPDIYTGVGLSHTDHGKTRRTPNDKIVAIAGLWADIDVNGGPDQKTGAAPDRDTARELAQEIAEPTILVDSGYGLQAWWLFDGGPWRFSTYGEQRLAARAAAQWQKLHRDKAGFGLDYTHDLARILRLPGTTNAKGGQRATVTVIETGPRHERDELLEIAGSAGDVDTGYAIGGETRTVDVSCRPDTPPARLGELQRSSPRFRKTWDHQRDDLPSMSEQDMALCSIAALAGWTDQELADLIVHHRETHHDPKARRADYVRRTVAKVRGTKEPDEPTPAKANGRVGTFTAEAWADQIVNGLQAKDSGAIALPFPALTDALDGGIRPGDLCLVAGWTSHGKSILVDQIADDAARQGRSVHLYLTEMTAYQRGLRLLARRAHIPFSKLKRRDLDKEQWAKAALALKDLPYGCSIVADWTVEDVVAHIRENQWDVAVVDLVHGFHYQDERDLSKTSSALVRAAKASSASGEHPGTAIVCAAHLNDGQMRDQRSPRRPRPGLHSIKGSSALKQDADIVMFVYREDDEDGAPGSEGSVWLAKARDGELTGVKVQLDVARLEFIETPSLQVVA